MNNETTIEEVAEAIKRGERVLLMTRHAERPHIDPEDPTFGESLPLTPSGEKMAYDFGTQLKAILPDETRVQFMASPLVRTRLTAATIAKGMGLGEKWNYESIPTDTLIGNGSPYYSDAYEVWKMFRGGEFYRISFEYCEKGMQTGFRPIAEATRMLEDFVLSRFTSQLGIFTSHDLFVAAFLSGKGVYSGWTEECWVGFLDSAAIFIASDGVKRYALVRRGA